MSIDMSQFHQVFFEETAEHLAAMENLLLTLDVAAPDSEQLNAIFRAAHSIKGSAGTFGFADLQGITHILENLLERLRRGEFPLRADMVDAFLAASDVLKNLLATHQGSAVADPVAAAAICERLRQLTTGNDLYFVLDATDDGAARAFDNLCAELETLGRVEIVARPGDGDPTWHLRLHGATADDSVREMLEFVARNDSIRILPIGMPRDVALGDSADGAYGFFGAGDPSAAAAEETAYGFFAPLEIPAADPGYGFFARPAPSAAPDAPAAPDASQPAAAKPAADRSIRVGVAKVDQLINLAGELVITQAMLAQAAAPIDPVAFERLHGGLTQLARNTRDLQEAVMSMRMMPMAAVFARFPRVVRDLSQKLGKQVELQLSGEDTELDRSLLERISDPLTHLVRNSLDHGIESAALRVAQGKPPVGTITLAAYHQSGNVVIEVGDDGAGLDRRKILAKARQRGIDVDERMSDQEVCALIFAAGFSTAERITEVSGRGVGMDVVKRSIAALGGRIDIDSPAGRGTRVTVRLPLTLAILDGMSVRVGEETYIVPLDYVSESLQVEPGMLKSVSGAACLLQLRGEYLPVVVLHEVFGVPGAGAPDQGIMLILEVDGVRAALCVDAMVGQHQVVIKSLEANYRKVSGVSGATIMGDGRVALILDVAPLVAQARNAQAAAA